MLADLQKKAQNLISDNASAILTAGGVIGTVTTAVLTGRATFKAAELIEMERIERLKRLPELPEDQTHELPMLERKEKILLVWPAYIPPVLAGSATIGSIILANRMSAQKAAALAAAYGLSQKQLDEYKSKVEEKLGVKKAEAIRDDIQQDRVRNNPPESSQVIIIGNGEVLCYDSYSGRYFKSTVEHIRRAETVVQREILHGNECSLQTFYDELDLPPIGLSNDVGWNINHPISVHISTVLSPDEEPCLAIEFAELPIYEYRIRY